MNKTLLALYGLKWNPFAPGVPAVPNPLCPCCQAESSKVVWVQPSAGLLMV